MKREKKEEQWPFRLFHVTSKKNLLAAASLIVSLMVLLTLALFSGWPIRAQQLPSSNTDYVDALWVAGSGGLVKVATVDGVVLLEIPEAQNLRAVAVDATRGNLWAYGESVLYAYRFDGLFVGSVPVQPDEDDDTHIGLAVDAHEGTVWLAVHKTLFQVNAEGLVLNTYLLPDIVQALALDQRRAQIWVATKTTVSAYDDSGRVVAVINPGKEAEVQDIDVDADSGDLWVALKNALRFYKGSDLKPFEIPIDKIRRVASDGQDGAWVATAKDLLLVAPSGQVLLIGKPFAGQETIVDLVADPSDGSVWVANQKALVHVGADGQMLRRMAWQEAQPDFSFDGRIHALSLYADIIPPLIAFTAPGNGTYINASTPHLIFTYSDAGSGVAPETLSIQSGGQDLEMNCSFGDTGATCMTATGLPEGPMTLSATIEDQAGNLSQPSEVTFTIDTIPPHIALTSPVDGTFTNQPQQTFSGYLSEVARLTIDGQEVSVGLDNTFSHGPITLQEGFNTFQLIAADLAGNSDELSVQVILDTVPPAAVNESQVHVSEVVDGQVTVSGAAESIEAGTMVAVTNTRTGQTATVGALPDGSFTAMIAARSGDQLAIVVTDGAGNASSPSTVSVGTALPPDPIEVAPPLNLTVATDLASATAFLYTGSPPIQTGVAPGTIEPRRAAVLRGQVWSRDGAPLSGVTIAILDHDEYGRTLTRAGGMFDMAINGGGLLTVRYEKDDYLPVQRQVRIPWRDYAWLPEVMMTPYDTRSTLIDLTMPDGIQVARGTVVMDGSGERQATLLFRPGTQAAMVLPDGSTQPLNTLHVRATEYTVGDSGPLSMPAELPATSAYTYAVELSADEAVAAGATKVQFTQPVILYVENFLNFPVGGIVPVGYYDRILGVWVPSRNGQIIEILSITGGLANLDTDGDGAPEEAGVLLSQGITGEERQLLASLYQPGQSLWRVLTTHFTPWDCNWPYGPPEDAEAPPDPDTKEEESVDDPDCQFGSVIECQTQILGESVGITGTAFRLHYQSDRVRGRKSPYNLEIPLSGWRVQASLKRIELEIFVAERRFTEKFPAAPDQRATFTWDGQDAYGRLIQGMQPVTIRLGYTYDAVYQQPAQLEQSFAALSGIPITGNRARSEVTLWREWQSVLVPWDAGAQNLGGWSLNVHHTYDPSGSVLYLGNGQRRSARNMNMVITTVAGTGGYGYSGDGGPATQAQLSFPFGVAVGADGSLYIEHYSRVRRVSPDGIITTIAGTGGYGYSGDGGPATQAQLNFIQGVAVGPDESLYIADSGNDRVRRVDRDGIITTVAGNGIRGYSGDGGPAIEAQLNYPQWLAVGPDGSIYIADYWHNRVRRVNPDGIITTVAGTGNYGYGGDGEPATLAQLKSPTGLAVGPDGSLYINESWGHRIRRVGPDGIITTISGDGNEGLGGEGVPAAQTQVADPEGIVADTDGSVYFSEINRIRRIGPDGIITTVAGEINRGYSGDGGGAMQGQLSWPEAVAMGPDRSLYIADMWNNRIRRVASPMPGFSYGNILIPAGDGSEIYVFNSAGRHLRTLDALTGALRYQFTYDSAGFLTAITDSADNVTSIERSPDGTPTAIVAPLGQRTILELDASAYLAAITDWAGQVMEFTYSNGGLLTALTDAKGNAYSFSYDSLGRLTQDWDPAGGFKTLARTDGSDGYMVDLTSALGRVTNYQVRKLPTGGQRRVKTFPGGLQTVTQIGTDDIRSITFPDGTVTSLEQGPDPRFGMQSPVTKSLKVRTPGGRVSTLTEIRTAVLADPLDPLSLERTTDKVTLNGRPFTTTFEAATREITSTTPLGRQAVTTLDAQGRVVEEQFAGLEPLQFDYDSRGRLTAITQGDRSFLFNYDTQGYLASITDRLSRSLGFAYDPVGQVTKQTLPDGREVLYSYDANGNTTSVTPPGRPNHAFTYTPVDITEDYIPPEVGAGTNLTHYTYNLDRQLVQVARPDGSTINLEYDGAGRLITVTTPRGQVSYAYHPSTGNLTTVTEPGGGTLT